VTRTQDREGHARSKQADHPLRHALKLLNRESLVPFSFLALGDGFAKTAWVLTVEGALHGL
jgi:hypothetical protein